MQDIFKETTELVDNEGARFSINFKKRNLRVNGKYIIKKGEHEGVLGFPTMPTTTDVLQTIEELYELYKHSIPSERSEGKKRNYFYALREKDLSDDDMLYGTGRDGAQVRLELFVLVMILNGSLKWDEATMGTWFWQSERDRDLVILRDWVEGE